MQGKTHTVAGLIATGALMYYYPVEVIPASIGFILGAKLPDKDRYIGMKHRGISHSLLAAITVGAVGYLINPSFGIALLINYILHLILDSLTKKGVPFFAPISKKYYGYKLVTSGSTEDTFLLIVLIWLASYLFSRL